MHAQLQGEIKSAQSAYAVNMIAWRLSRQKLTNRAAWSSAMSECDSRKHRLYSKKPAGVSKGLRESSCEHDAASTCQCWRLGLLLMHAQQLLRHWSTEQVHHDGHHCQPFQTASWWKAAMAQRGTTHTCRPKAFSTIQGCLHEAALHFLLYVVDWFDCMEVRFSERHRDGY